MDLTHPEYGAISEYLNNIQFSLLQGIYLTEEQIKNLNWYAEKAKKVIIEDLKNDIGLYEYGINLTTIIDALINAGWRKLV
ncbi:MAG: hypothetical protein PHC28_04905 [Flavobacterium sp.]|uniref:hypothetical protein n=1 Tax=Flavobacterium sp. TaxID=239 RepID=UPI002604D1A4|nr:hypothetical protein [Flavobacterium sp.]MDD5149805.1 hypothetical protein [Flavobacterium sp.]